MEDIENRKAIKLLNQKEETIKSLNEIIEIMRKETERVTENYNELIEKVIKLEKQILKLEGKT